MTQIEVELLKHGWTQKDLAERIGYAPATISQVVSQSRRAWPKLRNAIAEALGVAENELFNEDGTLKESTAEYITIPVKKIKGQK